MSVIKAILFYSRHDQKSFRIKQVIDSVGTDIETVSVDSLEVRERLLDDEKFGIDQVPTVLLLYSSGQHKTYVGASLDQWLEQLLFNIKQYQLQQTMPAPAPTTVFAPGVSPVDQGTGPFSLPSPGRPRDEGSTSLLDEPDLNPTSGGIGIGGGGSGMSGTTQVSGLGGVSSAQAAMISEHIKDPEPLIPITGNPPVKAGRKEVKKDGISAAELAKQMAQQREQFEEKLEQNRPFI